MFLRYAKKIVPIALALAIAVGVYDLGFMQGRTQAWISAGGLVAKDQRALIHDMNSPISLRPVDMSTADQAWAAGVYSSVTNRRIDGFRFGLGDSDCRCVGTPCNCSSRENC